MIEREYTVSSSPDFEVRIPSGRVEMVEGAAGTVKATVETKDPDFVVEQRGDLIVISSSSEARAWKDRSAHVVIEAPANSCAEITTASANITVRVPVHKASIKTASGNVTIDNADSAVIKTASGDATVRSVAKALRYNTASGDLEVQEYAGGTVVVVSVSGDVDIEKTDASLEVKTVSGNTKINYFAGKSANFRSVSGDIDLAVPSGTKLHLEADTRSGRVNFPTDPPRSKEVLREMTVRGRLVSGNVTIRRAPE